MNLIQMLRTLSESSAAPTQRATDATARLSRTSMEPEQIHGSGSASPGLTESGPPHNDPEDTGVLRAACRIVASGYKAEISRGGGSLLVSAAYLLLHRFLEVQFARQPRRRTVAWYEDSQ